MKINLRSTDIETTIIEKENLFDFYNYFNYTTDENVQKGKPYTFQQQSLIENFIEENYYLSIFPLLQAFNSVNTYPNKEIIELLLNICLNNKNEESVVREACNIVENISSIPDIYNYEKLKNNNKNFNLNKELPFEFIANEDESLYFDKIVYIMMNSLGNIEGYDKLNKENEPNEIMEEINKELFNIVRYKEIRKIEKPENMYLFFHTIITILKNDILQNQNIMKKTMLYRIIKKINLNKLMINICELYDYTLYHDYDTIPSIQSDIQLFIYMVSLYSYTKPMTSRDDKNYLINRDDIINIICSNITDKMLFPFIEGMIDIKVKQGIMERLLQKKCNFDGRRNVPLHLKLDEDKITAYCLNFIPLEKTCKGFLTIIHILFLLIQSYTLEHTLTEKHKTEWSNVLDDIEEIIHNFTSKNTIDPEEIQYEKELSNYYNLFNAIIMSYFQ